MSAPADDSSEILVDPSAPATTVTAPADLAIASEAVPVSAPAAAPASDLLAAPVLSATASAQSAAPGSYDGDAAAMAIDDALAALGRSASSTGPDPASEPAPSGPLAALLSQAEEDVGSPAAASTPAADAPTPQPTVVAAPAVPARATRPTQGPPLTRAQQLKQRVEEEPTDSQAWLALIADAEQKGDLERTREVYEAFFKVYPDASAQWIAYADLELQHSHFALVEAIFSRCLRQSTSVDLWRFYITYARRTNAIDPADPERAKAARTVVGKSFDFALAHIGIDREAGPIWRDYLAFLREGVTAGQWEEQQRMDALRKTYQRAICIPLGEVEQIWTEYNYFEQSINKMTAKKFLAERSAAYTSARVAAKEMGLKLAACKSTAPLPQRVDWSSAADRALVKGWRAYLAWEESNPLQLEDQAALQHRIGFAYRKATAELRFYPEVWFLASDNARKAGKADDALALLKAGMAANPLSLLVHYAYAELIEGQGELDECHRVYGELIERIHVQLDSRLATMESSIAEGIEQLPDHAAMPNGNAENGADAEMADGEDQTRAEQMAAVRKRVEDKHKSHLDALRDMAASVWITEMRFARRAEGNKALRAVFARARKGNPHLAWQVIEANAMIEYACNKDAKVATNIFELGMKTFGDEVKFVLCYLNYLISINDDTNARAVFERTISKVTADEARPLWDRWARYEAQFGDLAAIHKLDARISEAYPEAKSIFRFAERHVYLGLTQMIVKDLGMGVSVRARSATRSPSPDGARRKRGQSPDAAAPRGRVSRFDTGATPPGAKRRRNASPSPPRRFVPQARDVVPPPPMRRPVSPPRRATPPPMDDPLDGARALLEILPSAHSFNGPHFPAAAVMDLLATHPIPTSGPRMDGGPMGGGRFGARGGRGRR